MDQAAIASGKNVYGLSLGSVCGNSPQWQREAILNALVSDAIEVRCVCACMCVCVCVHACICACVWDSVHDITFLDTV
jgi:hypothetical protein